MKILVFGAGVIGTTYEWQLSNPGHEVVLFVREGKRHYVNMPKLEGYQEYYMASLTG